MWCGAARCGAVRCGAHLNQLVVRKRRRHVHAGVPVAIAGVHIFRERLEQNYHVDRARLKNCLLYTSPSPRDS